MLLDADTYMGTTEVVLDLTLWKPDGRRIGTYEGHAAKSDEFVPDEQNRPGVVSMGRSPRPSMKFAKRSSMCQCHETHGFPLPQSSRTD
jgi:hypothetical protein